MRPPNAHVEHESGGGGGGHPPMALAPGTTSPALPSGEQYFLRAGSYEAVVVEVGGGLRSLTFGGIDLVLGYGPGEVPTGAKGQILAPWPNRIDGGRYEFAGEKRQLDISEPAAGNAIHGLTRWASWRPHHARPPTQHRVDLVHRLHPHPGYPHLLDLVVTYELDGDSGLAVTIEARNVGGSPAPYGIGAHPYLTAGAETIDGCELTSPARTRMPTDERGLPTGREPVRGTDHDLRAGTMIGSRRLDGPYSDLDRDTDGRAWIRLVDPSKTRGVSLWMDASWDYLQVYTGDKLIRTPRAGIAVEPMSCPPNAFRSGEGLLVLAPDEAVTHTLGIAAVG